MRCTRNAVYPLGIGGSNPSLSAKIIHYFWILDYYIYYEFFGNRRTIRYSKTGFDQEALESLIQTTLNE